MILKQSSRAIILRGERGPAGPQGPSVAGPRGTTGPTGSAGAAWSSYSHAFGAAPTVTVNHNLGRIPGVSLRTTGGVEFDAQVVHINNNQFAVYFDKPTAGVAEIS